MVGRRARDLRGRALDVPVRPRRGRHPRRGYVGSGLPRAVPHERRPRVRDCTDDRHARRHHRVPDDPPDAGLHPDPAEAHLVEVHARRRSATPRGQGLLRQRAAGRRVRPVRRHRVGARQVHPHGPQPELLGHARRARRDHLRAVRGRRTRWSRRLQRGELDYVRGHRRRPLRRARRRSRTSGSSEGYANGYTIPVVQHAGDRRRATRARPRPSRTRRSATPSAGRSTEDRSSTACSTATASPGRRTSRRTTSTGTSSRPPRGRSTSPRRTAASMPPATRRGADGMRVDKEGKPIVTPADLAGRGHSADAQFIQGWWEQLGIGVDAFVTEEGTLVDVLYGPETGESTRTGTPTSGAGAATPTRCPSCRCSRRTRSRPASTTASTRTRATTSCSSSSSEAIDDDSAARPTSPRCSSCSTTAACNHILYYDSELHAMRTDKFTRLGQPAAGHRDAALRLRLQRLPGPDRRQRGADPGPDDGDRHRGTRQLRPARRPRRRRARTTRAAISTPLLIGGVIVLVVLVGGFVLMRRRGPKVEEE